MGKITMSYLAKIESQLYQIMQSATDEEKQDVADYVTATVRESYYNGINAGRKPSQSPGKPVGIAGAPSSR